MRLIRKYKNRKMYDTTTSKYVNFRELLAISSNEEVKVVESSENGDVDITSKILVAALVELPEMPTQEELRELIRKYHVEKLTEESLEEDLF